MIKKLLDLILYSNLWIALCAAAQVYQYKLIFSASQILDLFILFVFCSTLSLYAIHRVVGINKVKSFISLERFAVISNYRKHIFLYGSVGAIGAAYLFFTLPTRVQIGLIIPGLLSLLYVLPVLAKQLRLRDIAFLKIFLVAGVWASVMILLPALYYHEGFSIIMIPLFIEKFLFIFLITLPFDIRDRKVDLSSNLKTLPGNFDPNKIKTFMIILGACALLLCMLSYHLGSYSLMQSLCLAVSYLLITLICLQSYRYQHDYFFSGLIDGTMIFQALMIYMISHL